MRVELKTLRREFGSGAGRVTAVDDISLTVTDSEVYGLLGPNGAGKTTTLRMILGLLAPTSGQAIIDGLDVTVHPQAVKSRIGLVSASAGLYQWLTPREVLHYFADLYGVPTEPAKERATKLITLFGIDRYADRRCATLSTGQKQRVNLARSLMHDPPIVLLDEPTRGLDVVGSQVIFEYIGLLRDRGKAAIVCTHRLDEAERFCDRFGLLHAGQLRIEGTLGELRTATGCDSLTEIFVGQLDDRSRAPLSEISSGQPGDR